jgi:UDP-N-acetylmuramyl pentapeptide phosphotransferase/UDP-N-acetylglucosamine-1-phosphate transferase
MAFATAFGVVLFATPSLIKVAKLKHLVDEPSEERKMHQSSIPTIGGIMIFSAFLFACFLWFPDDKNTQTIISPFLYLMASLVLLFFVGVKDDIIGMSPTKKLVAHIIVGFILVAMGGIKITSMHGLFGLDVTFPEYAQLLISIFVYIVIVNAINLIDGVDGLASGVGLIASLIFGFWFYFAGAPHWALVSFSLAGALFGFLIFNFHPARIFMGDSGSLTIGAILSVLTIQLIETPTDFLPPLLSNISTPIFAIAVLSFPLLDTLRVFISRSLKGKSPLTADRNHLHHKLQDKGYGHKKVVFLIYMFNITIASIAAFLPTRFATITFGVCALASVLFIVFAVYPRPKK